MNTKIILGKVFLFLSAVILAGSIAVTSVFAATEKKWTRIPVELEGVKETYVNDFALGQEGVPWVTLSSPDNTVCYWKNGQWHKLSGDFVTGVYLSRLFVSSLGKVYLSQPGRDSYVSSAPHLKDHFGALYLMENEKATCITDYYYEVSREYPSLYFDSKGRIWNWGNKFIAKFENGEWEKIEASIGKSQGFWSSSIIEDINGNVFFIGSKNIASYKNGKFQVDIDMPKVPLQSSYLKARLWGKNKVLFLAYGKKGVAVLDLKNFKFEEGLFENTSLFKCSLYDLFRDLDGNIWILAYDRKKAANYFYIKVNCKDASLEEIVSTAEINWDNHRNSQYPESVLCAGDGAIYFGPPDNGVYIFRDGKVSHIGWKQGLDLNRTTWVYESPDQRIWFASYKRGIVVYDPQGEPGGLLSNVMKKWATFELSSRAVIKDYAGNIWCFLKDKPEKISMWNGQNWKHFETGINTTRAITLLIDNLNRPHIWMSDYQDGAHRLDPDGIVHFENFKELLVDSVATGSLRFRSSDPKHILPPLVMDGKKIWYCLHNYSHFYHYDGIQWQTFHMKDDVYHIFKWQNNSFMLRTQGGKFFAFDKGQLIEFTNEQTASKQYLFGECGYQLFDKGIYEANKDNLYPMIKTYKGIYLFKDLDNFLNFSESKIPKTAIKLSKYLDRIWMADGGFWVHDDNPLKRYYQGLLFKVDLSEIPMGAHGINVFEDQKGNLLLCRKDTMFMAQRGFVDTVITLPRKRIYETRRMHIPFSGTVDGKKSKKLSYSYKVDEDNWSEPSKTNFAELSFEESGVHNFRVMAIGEMGNIDTTPAELNFDIVVPFPEVRIVKPLRRCIKDLNVVIECEIVKKEESSNLFFQWRINGQKWNNTSESMIVLTGLPDGEHVFEVRAVEDGKYFQPLPARIKFVLAKDYKSIISREIERLKSGDYTEKEKAMAILASLGKKALPYLFKELEEVTPETEWWINNVIWQIQH